MTPDDDTNAFLNEPLTFAIVLRGSPKDVQYLKELLETTGLQIIYKTISYGELFIVKERPKNGDKD
jgi:hypothetical protein